MGSCISKCKPKKSPSPKKNQQQEQCLCIEKNNTTKITSSLVQDKLVISQTPISPPPPPSKIPLIVAPLSPSNSSSSTSLSCTNSNYPTTSSSSSSSSSLSSASSSISSILSSKSDRSFSSDFLWSCVKENPQLMRPNYPVTIVNPKIRSNLATTRYHNTSGNKPNGPPQSPQRVIRPTAQKRPRCSSPSNLTRQKSFRREPDRPNLSGSSRDLRPISPSPSRRFKGEPVVTSSMRRENYYVRPPSPNRSNSNNNNNSRRYGRSNNLLVKGENDGIKQVGLKIEELGIGDLMSSQDMDLMPIEDANNPHIALDCFIFL